MSSRAVAEQIIATRSVASPAEWDAFAQRAGGSFRGGYWAAVAWQFEHHRWFRLRRLDVCVVDASGRPRKVGQCAVGVGRQVRAFADGLQLLPEAASMWPRAMSATLDALRAGEFVYGSEWSLEPPREATIADLPGVRINAVAPTRVMTIDFARWRDVEAYRRAISTNVRRNVKKAIKTHPSMRLTVTPGVGGVGAFARAAMLRRSLFARKGVTRSTIGMVARSAARLLSLRRYSESAYLFDGVGTLLASYGGVTFGDVHAYLEGASGEANRGASWYLLTSMIERAFAASGGRGRFVMGSDDGTKAGEAWDGLRRSREQCCATAVATSVVRFTYGPSRDVAQRFPAGCDAPQPTGDGRAILVAARGRTSAVPALSIRSEQ